MGDFGEQLVMFIIGRLYEHRVAYVDHVGADLIATDKDQKKYAISVKSRVFTTDGPQQPFDESQQDKLRDFADSFGLIPAVAFEPNRRPAAIACHNSRLYGRLPLAKVVFFVYSHFAPDNKNPHR